MVQPHPNEAVRYLLADDQAVGCSCARSDEDEPIIEQEQAQVTTGRSSCSDSRWQQIAFSEPGVVSSIMSMLTTSAAGAYFVADCGDWSKHQQKQVANNNNSYSYYQASDKHQRPPEQSGLSILCHFCPLTPSTTASSTATTTRRSAAPTAARVTTNTATTKPSLAYSLICVALILMNLLDQAPVANCVDCFKCSSRNGSNPACEDPFHNLNSTRITTAQVPENTPNVILHSPCYAGKKGRKGLFPASACIKLIGTFDNSQEKLVVRHCALDSGTLTQDTELARISHCGKFQFEGDLLKGCVLSCPEDACNSSPGSVFVAGARHSNRWMLMPIVCVLISTSVILYQVIGTKSIAAIKNNS